MVETEKLRRTTLDQVVFKEFILFSISVSRGIRAHPIPLVDGIITHVVFLSPPWSHDIS